MSPNILGITAWITFTVACIVALAADTEVGAALGVIAQGVCLIAVIVAKKETDRP